MKIVWILMKETYAQWSDDKAARLGAALAYYAVFSLGPLLVVIIAVAGLIFGQETVRGEVVAALRDVLGGAGATAVESMLTQASQPRQGSWALIIGGATLVLGALGVVVQLKDALNAIWNVDARKDKGVWPFLRTYVISTAAVLALAFLLLISMAMSAAVTALGELLLDGVGETLVHIVDFGLNLGIMTLLFAMMFKWLPDIEISWRDVGIGAFVTALLFVIGKFAIGLYLGGTNAESAFGASASLVVVLVWVYYTAQIVFLGAEFTQVFARRFGSQRGKPHVPAAAERAIEQPPAHRPPSRGLVLTALVALALSWLKHRKALAR